MRLAATSCVDPWAASSRSTFPSIDAMEQLIAMGAEEGMLRALGQIDAILSEPAGT
jgi:hypothetical protein